MHIMDSLIFDFGIMHPINYIIVRQHLVRIFGFHKVPSYECVSAICFVFIINFGF